MISKDPSIRRYEYAKTAGDISRALIDMFEEDGDTSLNFFSSHDEKRSFIIDDRLVSNRKKSIDVVEIKNRRRGRKASLFCVL